MAPTRTGTPNDQSIPNNSANTIPNREQVPVAIPTNIPRNNTNPLRGLPLEALLTIVAAHPTTGNYNFRSLRHTLNNPITRNNTRSITPTPVSSIPPTPQIPEHQTTPIPSNQNNLNQQQAQNAPAPSTYLALRAYHEINRRLMNLGQRSNTPSGL